MADEKKEISLLEKNLTLVVKEQKLGELITNAKEIQKFVSEKLKEYTPDNYTGDEKTIDKDKADLNNAIKKLNSERIRLENEFMKPFQEFKNVVSDTCKMLDQASNQLKIIIDDRENKRKEEKLQEIQKYYNSLNFNKLDYSKIHNSRWLNKTYKIKDIQQEINSKVEEIKNNLEFINSKYPDPDRGLLKIEYLSCLNMDLIINHANALEAERQKNQNQEPQEATKEIPQTRQNIQPVVKQQKLRPFNFNITTPITYLAEKSGLDVKINIEGSVSKCQIFRELLAKNGYEYEKDKLEDGTLLLKIRKVGNTVIF